MQARTLEEVARRAGVSRSTVSRVINDHPNVRPEVRDRVRQVILETGYQPHAAARSLASRRSHVLGLVIPRSVHTFFSDPYFPLLTQGIAEMCNRRDYTLSFFLLNNPEAERKIVARITQRGFVDGLIIQSTNLKDTLLDQVRAGRVPFVVTGRPLNPGKIHYIDIDNISGAYQAVRHLAGLGRARIAAIAAPLDTSTGLDRMEGYRRALQASGLNLDEKLVESGDFSEQSGYQAALKLLEQRPDAIFAAADMMAYGAMRAVRSAGLRVPEDIALVGFDDLPAPTGMQPALTTVHQPIQAFGSQAVELLLQVMQDKSLPPQKRILETELVVRESCGAALGGDQGL